MYRKDNHGFAALTGLHHKTRQHFRQAGIHSLQQIAAMDIDDLQKFSNIGPKTAPAIKAQAQAYLSNSPVWCGTLPKVCQEQGWYFDIETNPSTDEVWSIGWCWHDQAVQNVIVMPNAAPQSLTLPGGSQIMLVPTASDAWVAFAEAVWNSSSPVYHWTGFDASNMRRFAPEHIRQGLNRRLHDLHSSFKQTVQLPQRSTSLKAVAPFLGFAWQGYQDWWQAYQDYSMYLRTYDSDYLTNACAYQADDVKAMIVVWKWLNQNSIE